MSTDTLTPSEALAAAAVTAKFTGEADIWVLTWQRGASLLMWPCLTQERALQEAARQVNGDFRGRGRAPTLAEMAAVIDELKEGREVESPSGAYCLRMESLLA